MITLAKKSSEVTETSVTREGEKLDYSDVDQGQEEQPALQETTTVDIDKTKRKGRRGKKGSGGKKGGSGSSSLNKYREQIRCGMCDNPMTMSKAINVHEIPGKKIPKGVDGKPSFESPGAASGKLVGVLCDDCERSSTTTAVSPDGSTTGIDIKTAVAVRSDGTVNMVKLSELSG